MRWPFLFLGIPSTEDDLAGLESDNVVAGGGTTDTAGFAAMDAHNPAGEDDADGFAEIVVKALGRGVDKGVEPGVNSLISPTSKFDSCLVITELLLDTNFVSRMWSKLTVSKGEMAVLLSCVVPSIKVMREKFRSSLAVCWRRSEYLLSFEQQSII